MIRWLLLVFGCMMPLQALACSVTVDLYQAMQQRTVIRYECELDIQESIVLGYNQYNFGDSSVSIFTANWGISYRRYIEKQTAHGPFYSLGLRYGSLFMDDGTTEETDRLIMPYYDVGFKTKLSSEWSHVMAIEAGYVVAYSENVAIYDYIGLTLTLYYAFSYQLDAL